MTNRNPERHFLSLADWPAERLRETLELAARLKEDRTRPDSARARAAAGERAPPDAAGRDGGAVARRAPLPLAGRTLGMIFEKSSTRTRVSFEAGMFQLGGHALFLSSRDIQLGRGEPIADTARVLSRYLDAVMIRTFDQSDVEELAEHGSIPVINGLTDRLHPCQVLADLLTIREEFGSALDGTRVAWVGDGNNMANSWLNAARRFGLDLRLACPEGFGPDPELLEAARSRGCATRVREPEEAASGARVVTTDVWASMGQEEEAERRRRAFRGYVVDAALMERADPDAIFLHCLPAHRGEEVASDVIDGPRSRVWDEAENRLHAQKALLLRLLGREDRDAGRTDETRREEPATKTRKGG